MIVYPDGNIETGPWLTAATYPEKTYYVVDESTPAGAALRDKILDLHPYYTINVVGNELVDVTAREKTPEEVAAEQPAPQPPDRITKLEAENAQLKLDMADVQLALADLFTV